MIAKYKEQVKELVRYGIVGVATTVVSLGIYYGLVYWLLDPTKPLELQAANIISWIGAVSFAFFTNRRFVFEKTGDGVLKDMVAFFTSRLMSLGLDMLVMFMGVTILGISDTIVKIASQVIITIVNYLVSKFWVFKNK